ncbi:type 1 glutamine amidotransferase [Gracilimonas mengyeensis]|uniref:GMP synthase-Glutamine amidotransferase n=1 Tax=Gracilimonas mengyeensis TaxID=1302730 RepID=A0A521DTC5_9BACT|nr:type 1 glutamine amidotransferase [Gracilimonas mengyeensis]SMO74361.1 GMP synthase-Glutamine amidotransferase [Gracilimonas mengyeensis]
MRIHYIQHVSFENPGYIKTWAEENGHILTGTFLFDGQELPSPQEIDALVVMGGPMGVADEEAYLWLRREKAFIKECITLNKKVLGICLGAQLIADVLDAEVTPMPQKEIGWFPLKWTEKAIEHPLFHSFPKQQTVLHWHGDRFEIPKGALPLAASKGCNKQGFLWNERVLGLQFHMEMTQEGLAALIKNSTDELAKAKGPFIQHANTMLNKQLYTDNHQMMEQLLDRFLGSE